MPSIATAAGYSRNNKNSDNYSTNNYGSNPANRPSLTWTNGTNGNGIPTWGSSAGNSSYHSQPLNGNNNNGRIYGNGGPITTVIAPPKHPCLINLDPLGTSFFQYPLLPGKKKQVPRLICMH